MEPEEKIYDSRVGNVKAHIQKYLESNGAKGHIYRGLPTLLLITRGRKSGKLRRVALIYGRDGSRYLLAASNGGSPHHPGWYLNLLENPEVQVQVGAEKFTALARRATPEEKQRYWPVMIKIFPTYVQYQRKAGRNIPMVILERK